jgi:hypothetical protein
MKSAFATFVAMPNAKTNTSEIVFFILSPFQNTMHTFTALALSFWIISSKKFIRHEYLI